MECVAIYEQKLPRNEAQFRSQNELSLRLTNGTRTFGSSGHGSKANWKKNAARWQVAINHEPSCFGDANNFITPYPSESQRAKCFVVAPGQLLTTRDRQAVEMPSTQSIAGRQPKPTSTRANCTPPSECITCDWVAKVSAANQTGLVLAYWPIGYLGLAPRLPKLSKPFNAYQRSVGAPRGR